MKTLDETGPNGVDGSGIFSKIESATKIDLQLESDAGSKEEMLTKEEMPLTAAVFIAARILYRRQKVLSYVIIEGLLGK